MASAAPDNICGDNVECGGFPTDPYRLYLTQFINSFVDGTISDLQAKDRILSEIPKEKIPALKKEVFEMCTNHDFLANLNKFNTFMKTAASIVDIGEDGNGTSIYEDTPLQNFIVGERVVDSRVVSLYIAGFTLHKFLQDPSFTMHIPRIHMSDLNTFRRLLPNSEDLTSAYFSRQSIIKTGFVSFTPDNDELIVLATNFFSNHLDFAANRAALARTIIFMDNREKREGRAGPLETGTIFSSGGNFGLKKRNKSKRRNQKKSNKKSRRHRNRKRLSRRNAKRLSRRNAKRLSRRNAKRFY
jgi:hypothetical protein